MASLLRRLSEAIRRFDQAIDVVFGRGFPPAAACAIDFNHSASQATAPAPYSFKDFLNDTILWAAPTHRATIERRLKRRFGDKKYIWKPPVAKTNILMCPTCGHDYEAGRLCGHCYERVKAETQKLQEKIAEHLKLRPVEKEVIVLYENEKPRVEKERAKWKEYDVVEVEGERPSWFHSNLLQPTTQETSDEGTVKPKDII